MSVDSGPGAQTDEQRNHEIAWLRFVAHEVSNLQFPLQLALQLVDRPGTTAQTRYLLEWEVSQMARLVDRVRALTRLLNPGELQTTMLDVRDLITRVVTATRPLADERRHDLEAVLPEEPAEVQIDPVEFERTLRHLVYNAIDFTPIGGRIRLVLSREGDWLVIRVSDSGPGIPQTLRNQLFELFTNPPQSEPGTPTSRLRVGLSYARQVVEGHGGEIDIEQRSDDAGTEFVIRLPLPESVG